MEGMQQQFLEILERLVRLETKIDGYNQLRERVDATHSLATQNDKEISEIKDNQKWLWRTIAGAIILGFIATFVQFG